MFTVSGRLSTFTRATRKAGECLQSLKKSQRQLELPQASPMAVCDCSLPTFPASFSLPWLVSDAIPNGLRITLYSICTDTCLDKFENPCSFLHRTFAYTIPTWNALPFPPFLTRKAFILRETAHRVSLSQRLLWPLRNLFFHWAPLPHYSTSWSSLPLAWTESLGSSDCVFPPP